MRSIRQPVFVLLSVFAMAACGCSSSGTLVRDTLDPVTGITITHAEVPLIFYRDQSARAAYARDFVNLAPIQINRMGRYRYFLWLAAWSTMQNVHLAEELDGFESIIVFADGEPLTLSSTGWTPQAIGATEPVYAKPVASAAEAYYEVTVDQLRLIAQAADVRLRSTGPRARAYEPWDSQTSAHASLQAFLEYVSY